MEPQVQAHDKKVPTLAGECTEPHCCTVCQLWTEEGKTEGACLGKVFSGWFKNPEGNLVLNYTMGDLVPPNNQRSVLVTLVPGPSSWEIVSFKQPSGPSPDGTIIFSGKLIGVGTFHYGVTVSTNLVAGRCSGTSCHTCTSVSEECLWCLESSSCASSPGPNCQFYIKTPEYCPSCIATSCVECASSGCSWCIDNQMCGDGSVCPGNSVTNPEKCSSK